MGLHKWFKTNFMVGSRMEREERYWEEVWFADLRGWKFYMLKRDLTEFKSIINDQCLRKEYFEYKIKRWYEGRQNCFIEFCNALVPFVTAGVFPTEADFKEAAKKLNLPIETGRLYAYYYRKFFQL